MTEVIQQVDVQSSDRDKTALGGVDGLGDSCCRITVYYFTFFSIFWLLFTVLGHTRPALPICIISPVTFSSPLNTGQLVPSALTRLNSTLVPMIL